MYLLICSCCLFSSGVHGPWAKAPTPQPTQQNGPFCWVSASTLLRLELEHQAFSKRVRVSEVTGQR